MTSPALDETAVRRLPESVDTRGIRGHQGNVYLGTIDGLRVAVKAASGNRLTRPLRCWLLRREHAVYRRLEGLTGIPRCLGLVAGQYLVIERIDGCVYREATIRDRDRFFRRFFEILESMHARGVAHGDLMRKDNILVTGDSEPVLIDFGLSAIRLDGFHPVNHAVYRFLRQHDINAWLKHKYRRRWTQMTPDDARYHRVQRLDRLARRIKRGWMIATGRRSQL